MKLPIYFLLLLLSGSISAQELFGVSGGSVSDASHQFDFSVGESVTTTIGNGQNTFNIGFQQPYYDFFTSVSNSEITGYQIFPNPFSNAFHFVASSEIEHFFLTDASDREVFRSHTSGKEFEFKESNLPNGFYHLSVQLVNGKTINSKIIQQ